MKYLAALLLTFCSLAAQADELIVGHLSKHFNPDVQMRERNPGIGWRTEIQDYHVQFGHYRNSYDRSTNYLLVDMYERPLVGELSLRILGGIATGYADSARPLVVPVLSYPLTSGVHLDMIVIPPVTGTTVLAFSLRFNIR